MLELVIGNKNYSSWSLRPWFLLKTLGLPFIETRIALFEPASATALAGVAPAGKVPVLRDGPVTVWESLAICEYVAERAPQAWPADPATRAHARSIAHEMHAGFQALRSEFPLNCRARRAGVTASAAAARDIARVQALWQECRSRWGSAGPWLYGGFSIADAMYAPVVSRFATYGIVSAGLAGDYAAHVLASPALREWLAGAAAETEVVARVEIGEPVH
jgi:glutathione S-transferase